MKTSISVFIILTLVFLICAIVVSYNQFEYRSNICAQTGKIYSSESDACIFGDRPWENGR